MYYKHKEIIYLNILHPPPKQSVIKNYQLNFRIFIMSLHDDSFKMKVELKDINVKLKMAALGMLPKIRLRIIVTFISLLSDINFCYTV